jgi:hypothetical protein
MSALDATLYLLGDTRQERAHLSIEVMDYQLIALAAAVFVLSVYAYSVGLREGKRVGYHRGRAISFNQYKEDHK